MCSSGSSYPRCSIFVWKRTLDVFSPRILSRSLLNATKWFASATSYGNIHTCSVEKYFLLFYSAIWQLLVPLALIALVVGRKKKSFIFFQLWKTSIMFLLCNFFMRVLLNFLICGIQDIHPLCIFFNSAIVWDVRSKTTYSAEEKHRPHWEITTCSASLFISYL